MQLNNLNLFVLIGYFWRTYLLIPTNLPAGDNLTTAVLHDVQGIMNFGLKLKNE
jgi:hypothetical protein